MFTSVMFRISAIALIALGSLTTVVALAFLSEATMGVGIIGVGLFMGVCARMFQAAAHQYEDAESARKRQSAISHMLEQIYAQGAKGDPEKIE